jgi:hypothetical protein
VNACTGLENLGGIPGLQVYPNPAGAALYVSLSHEQSDLLVNIYAGNGSLVKTQKLAAENNAIDIAELARGIYMVEIMHNGKPVELKRILKE